MLNRLCPDYVSRFGRLYRAEAIHAIGRKTWVFRLQSMVPTSVSAGPRTRIRAHEALKIPNLAYGGAGRRDLGITEADSGAIPRARLPTPGQELFSPSRGGEDGAGQR